MMPIYCLCEAKNDKPDSQAFGARNRYCALQNERPGDFPPLALYQPMICIKVGAQQVLLDNPRPNLHTDEGRPAGWRKHYPNVDVFECPNCGARIAR